jgi:YidC/Oxa1 family membrane protein insertase
MDTLRFILILSLALVGMLIWQAWEQDYGRPAAEQASAAQEEAARSADIPEFIEAGDEPAAAAVLPITDAADDGRVTAETDVLRMEFSLRGATLRRAELPLYTVSLDRPDEPVVLLDDSGPQIHIVQGGLVGGGPAPTHEDRFSSENSSYVLEPGQDVLRVPFTWNDGGLRVTKTYELRRGSYLVRVQYRVENLGSEDWQGRSYSQIQRSDPETARARLIYTYTGAVLSSPEKRYSKITFEDMRETKLDRDIRGGWIAMLQHYFVAALVPVDREAVYRFYTMQLPQERFAIGVFSPRVTVAAGESGLIEEQFFVGPKLQSVLAEIADGLDLTVDYGPLWFIAKPLHWMLDWLHGVTGNWGWAIIFVTVLLKLLFYHLSAAGYRSMANMRRVQPRIMAIRDRYKNDRARLNQAMMQIYKEEKINPFGGCLPILIQIPVFIALYWVLLESVELRQAPFILWLNDLSSPDRYWVLPIIMGVTMFIQQKLNPAPLDPVQEKVMMALPFVFTIFFGFFPSGLVLYWVVNNVLSIAQQWLITRSLERAAAPHGKS